MSACCLLLLILARQEAHPTVSPPPALRAADFNKSLLRFIEDNGPVRNDRENHDEALAFDSIVTFASRVSIESFRSSARRDLTFVQLLGTDASQYRGEVIEAKGRLLRNLDVGPTPAMKADGIQSLFEAYIRSEDHAGLGWCVFHTDSTIGVGDNLWIPVVTHGYFFKVYAYRERDKTFRLPLLVAHGIERQPVDSRPGVGDAVTLGGPLFLLMGVTAAATVALIAWFLMDDWRTRSRIQSARSTKRIAE